MAASARIGAMSGWVLASALALSALGKFASLPFFADELRAWSVLRSDALRTLLVPLVPSVELALALSWALGFARRRTAMLSCALVAVFTVAYGAELTSGGRPSCGCFGLLLAHKQLAASAPLVLARNGVLLVLGAFAVRWSIRRRNTEGRRALGGRPAVRGFTLVETILVVLLVGLLVALVLPSLGGARLSARLAKSQANARTHATAFQLYCLDFRDVNPYFTDPHATKSVVRCLSRDVAWIGQYFDACVLWPAGLADGYYQGALESPTFRDPVEPNQLYFYPCCFIAAPEYWDVLTRLNPPAQWVPTRVTDVLDPSRKVWAASDWYSRLRTGRGDRIAVGCVDGHAALPARSAVREQLPGGDGVYAGSGHLHFNTQSILHTRMGVRGRDLE